MNDDCGARRRRRGIGRLEAERRRWAELADIEASIEERCCDPAAAAVSMGEQLALLDWGSLDGEAQMATTLALEGIRRRLDAVIASGMGHLQRCGVTWAAAGLGAPAWRANATHGSLPAAKRDLAVATTLERFDAFGTELAAGVISADHVAALHAVCNPRILDGLVAIEADLLHMARVSSFAAFRRHLRVLARTLDVDGPQPDCGDRDTAKMGTGLDGALYLIVELTGHDAVVAQRIINDGTDRQHRAAVREHEAAGTPIPGVGVLRARAVVELLRRGTANDPDDTSKPRTEAILPVTVDDRGHPTGVHSIDGEPLDERTAAALACDVWLQPVVIDTNATPLYCARTQRWFTPAQRRALVVRDGRCVFPGCDVPASWCDAHHIIAWVDGGSTDIDNGALLCRRHHGLVHSRDAWILEAIPLEDPPPITPRSKGPPANRGVRLRWHTPDGRILAAQTAADQRPPTSTLAPDHGATR